MSKDSLSPREARSDEGHTPTPWRQYGVEIIGAEGTKEGRAICALTHGRMSSAPRLNVGDDDWEKQMTNAAFIVRACNAHDELMTTLSFVESCLSGELGADSKKTLLNLCRAALAKAKAP